MGTRQVCGEAEFTAIFAETQERLPLPPLLPAKAINGPPVLTPAGASEAHAGARRLLFYSYCTLSHFSQEKHGRLWLMYGGLRWLHLLVCFSPSVWFIARRRSFIFHTLVSFMRVCVCV